MTPRTNGRIAGVTFLLYIATGIGSMVLFDQAKGGGGEAAAQLANIAQHATAVRLTAVLILLQFLYAVVLGVTLYALTRDQDRDLAVLALCCRVAEGVLAAVDTVRKLELVSVATASTTGGPEAATAQALGALLLTDHSYAVAATCFAVGSTIFSWLLLRARSIPVSLAGLGVVASVLLLVLLPGQIMGFVRGAVTGYMWFPMALFEVVLALWLIFKGVAEPRTAPARS